MIIDFHICFRGGNKHAHVPSGYVKIAIENDHRNSGFTHWKWWFSVVMLVYERVTGNTPRFVTGNLPHGSSQTEHLLLLELCNLLIQPASRELHPQHKTHTEYPHGTRMDANHLLTGIKASCFPLTSITWSITQEIKHNSSWKLWTERGNV